MKNYIACIQKRTEYGNRHFAFSNGDTKERFIERIQACYGIPDHYYEVEIYELGEMIANF